MEKENYTLEDFKNGLVCIKYLGKYHYLQAIFYGITNVFTEDKSIYNIGDFLYWDNGIKKILKPNKEGLPYVSEENILMEEKMWRNFLDNDKESLNLSYTHSELDLIKKATDDFIRINNEKIKAMSKGLEIHFIVKKAIVVVSDNNLIGLASSLKFNGFKPKSKIVYQNLSEEQLAELLGIVFPLKKTRKEKVWERILKDINTDDSLFCKSPTLTEALSKKEIVNKISEMADIPPRYTIKRQPTFFARETKVSYNQLKEIFTDKAIKAMVEEGYLDTGVKLPIAYWNGINYDSIVEKLDLSKMIEKPYFPQVGNHLHLQFEPSAGKSFMDWHEEQMKQKLKEEIDRIEKFTDDAIEKGLKGECAGGIFPSQIESLSQEDCDDLEIGFENICDKLDFIIDLMENNFPDTNDIYISKKDFALLCESFGGKVKKYKGHNIIEDDKV